VLHDLAFVAILRSLNERKKAQLSKYWTMQITINGQAHFFDDVSTLATLLVHLGVPQETGLAVAHNSTLITRNRLSEICLREGDRVEIIRATAGG